MTKMSISALKKSLIIRFGGWRGDGWSRTYPRACSGTFIVGLLSLVISSVFHTTSKRNLLFKL